MINYGYGYNPYYYSSVGAWPLGYIGQDSPYAQHGLVDGVPVDVATGEALRRALVDRWYFVMRSRLPKGQQFLGRAPSAQDLGDFLLEMAIEGYYGDGAHLSGPQIKARLQQMLARIRG
jgi:hypothetical protein